jgi:hypothetical protein
METLEWDIMEIPEKTKLWNYSIAVTLPDGRIFISGGINYELKDIKSDAFILTPHGSTFLLEELPDMTEKRYTHTSVYLNGHVYCLGGRTFGDVTSSLHSPQMVFTTNARDSTSRPRNGSPLLR